MKSKLNGLWMRMAWWYRDLAANGNAAPCRVDGDFQVIGNRQRLFFSQKGIGEAQYKNEDEKQIVTWPMNEHLE